MNNRALFYDSMRAAGVCSGTIQARTHVQLAIACQQALIHAQRRLRFTVQQVYGRRGNLGNKCAFHAAAHGTFGFISSHNIATRWFHHNFDANMCFNECSNIGDVLERLQTIRTNAVSLPHDRG